MSAFLGLIHHWVFKKVKFQNEITEQLIALAHERGVNIAAVLKEKYGVLEYAPLETVVDTSNIHGWLQQRVSLVEYRLAAAVKMILAQGVADENELRQLFFNMGISVKEVPLPNAITAYNLLNDLLLDGMPCDRANELIAEHNDQVDWRVNHCVHRPYWEETGIDISLYYALRESLIAGLLDGSDYELIKREKEYAIKKRG